MSQLEASIGGGTVSLIVLTALYGVYLVLFVLATWSTYLRPTSLSLPLRTSVLTMFAILLAHIVLQLYIWSMIVDDGGSVPETSRVYVALTVVDNLLICFSAFIGQCHLAWRTFNLWGRPPWMKRVLPVVIGLGTVFGCLANAALARRATITYQIFCVWGWWTCIVHSSLSATVTKRILKNLSARKSQASPAIVPRPQVTAVRILVDSSAISWIGVAAYPIVSTIFWARQNGSGTRTAGLGVLSVLPVLFGISHSLSVALIGLSHFVSAAPPKRSTLAFAPAMTTHADVQSGFVIKLGDTLEMSDVQSPSVRVEHEVVYHKD